MTIFWISLAAVVVFMVIGYRRGVLRIITFLCALLLAGLAAMPLASWFSPLIQRIGFIPNAFKPVAAPLLAGLVVLIVLDVIMAWMLKRREQAREKQKLSRLAPWERISGAMIGGLWGCVLVTLVLTGLHLVGRVEQELMQHPTPPPSGIESPTPLVTPQTTYQTLNEQIDASPLGPIVQHANPAEERIALIFGDLAKVTSDPVLLERFRQHPAIVQFTEQPQLQAIAQDATIQQLLENRHYYALLDHPKLAALFQDKALIAACGKVDLAAVLSEVQRAPVP